MSLTYIEELTIRTYSEIGIYPHILMRPQKWLRARQLVARLMACKLDPDDSLYGELSSEDAAEVMLICERLKALHERYGRRG